jgi:hypothetical protein
VLLFEREDDARRVLAVISRRFAKYGLTVHPEKTRLVNFSRPPLNAARSGPYTDTFDLLGFTHYWGRSRRGYWAIKRQTAKDRLRRSLVHLNHWCRLHRHLRVKDQWEILRRKLAGHYAYFGVPSNLRALRSFWEAAKRIWRFWLARRSQHGQMPWTRFNSLLDAYPLPRPRIPVAHRT